MNDSETGQVGQRMSCKLYNNAVLVDEGGLEISFGRTFRIPNVPDHGVYGRTDQGILELKPISKYATEPEDMFSWEDQNGVFLTLFQSEAMYIQIDHYSHRPYIVKIYMDGVNILSGETVNEHAARRRQDAQADKLLCSGPPRPPLQDYIVLRGKAGRAFADGVMDQEDEDGAARQFTAVRFDESLGHECIRQQMVALESEGNIQIEVTPYKENINPVGYAEVSYEPIARPEYAEGKHEIGIFDEKKLHVEKIKANLEETVLVLKCRIQDKMVGVPGPPHQVLWLHDPALEDDRTLASYGIHDKQALTLTYDSEPDYDYGEPMPIATGNKVYQTHLRDCHPAQNWDPSRTTVFNVQILTPAAHYHITGEVVPEEFKLNAEIYEEFGVPYPDWYDEKRSIAYIEAQDIDIKFERMKHGSDEEDEVEDEESEDGEDVDVTNPKGPLREFRTLSELEDMYGRRGY